MNQLHGSGVAPKRTFSTGQLYMTVGVLRKLGHEEITNAFQRHAMGDWGDAFAEDKEANERALESGERLVSVYHTSKGVKFWIITEANRAVTTVLLPNDY